MFILRQKERLPITVIIVLCSIATASCGNGTNACGETQPDPNCRTLVSDGMERAYLLHIPTNFQAGLSALVIALHAANFSGLTFSQLTNLNAKADQEGFAIVYPYSLISPSTGVSEWNNFFNTAFGDNGPDDVGFIRQLITVLQSELRPNPKEIFVTGLSRGGFMAHRVGIELSDLIAAIGVVEGTVVSPGSINNVPAIGGPVSVLILHGDQDSVVPYCAYPPVASQEVTFDYWVGNSGDKCGSLDPSAPLCNSEGNITSVSEKDAMACSGGVEVRFYKLEGGGHAWYETAMDVSGQLPFNLILIPPLALRQTIFCGIFLSSIRSPELGTFPIEKFGWSSGYANSKLE